MKLTKRHSFGAPRLCYTDSGGTGPTLLLLHGVTRSAGDWEPVLAALSDSWRVLSLDQRGHGRSARTNRYLVTDYVEDAVRFVKEEIAAPVVLIGHSLGAMVAAGVATELPQLVRGIVLEDPPFHTMGNRIADSTWHALFLGMRKAAEQGHDVASTTALLADICLSVRGGSMQRLGDLRDRASLEWSAECLRQLDPLVLAPVVEGNWLEGYDVTGVFSRIRCPALLLQADPSAGGALTDEDASTLAALPYCQLVKFLGAGHQLHRDNTQSVLQTLKGFLDQIRTSANTNAS
ncbi:MAG: alpha/beta hydrolase [Aureliella sp.]